MPYYQSAGIRLHYEDHGAGEPLILLHGFGQDGSAWIDPLPAYARFFRVLVMDMRGCGRSDVTEPGYSPKDLAGDVVALMDHIGADKAHFAGFSLGGAVGLELGIAHSDRLMSLSLHSTWEGGPCPHMKRWIEVRRRIIEIGDPLVNAGTRVVSFFSPEFANEHEDRVEAFINRSASNPFPITPKGIQGHAAACLNHDSRGRIDQITTPTLVTVGSLDRSTLPSQARALHEQILGSEFVLIDGCGHFTPYQSPGEFVSISLGFLIKHGPGLDQPPSLMSTYRV
jgi:pimeloyl-ACP methyl ester carboxylesterase